MHFRYFDISLIFNNFLSVLAFNIQIVVLCVPFSRFNGSFRGSSLIINAFFRMISRTFYNIFKEIFFLKKL